MPKRNGEGIALLADPTRRRIIALIARQVRRPSRIASELGLSRPAVSRQLRLLREVGLIDWSYYPGDGRSISYYLNRDMAAPIIAWLAGTEIGLDDRGRVIGGRLEPVRSDLLRLTVSGQPRAAGSTPSSGDGSV